MTNRNGSRSTFAVACLLSLSGCVGALLGGGKPDALYRFGATPSGATSQSSTVPRRILAMPTPEFAPAAGGDRILTVQGNETSYIKDMRWVTPAPALYAAAVEATVADRAPDILMASRNSATSAGAVLTVSIDQFEATYATSDTTPPVIHIKGSGILFDRVGKRIIGRHGISAVEPAAANTGPAIAAAFDVAVGRTVVQLVDWTNVTMPLPRKGRP